MQISVLGILISKFRNKTNKTTNNFRFEDHSEEQDLIIWKDPVFNYMDFFISAAYARHKSVISGKLVDLIISQWLKKLVKNVTLQILKFNLVSWIIEHSPYGVMLIFSLFPLQ